MAIEWFGTGHSHCLSTGQKHMPMFPTSIRVVICFREYSISNNAHTFTQYSVCVCFIFIISNVFVVVPLACFTYKYMIYSKYTIYNKSNVCVLCMFVCGRIEFVQ